LVVSDILELSGHVTRHLRL